MDELLGRRALLKILKTTDVHLTAEEIDVAKATFKIGEVMSLELAKLYKIAAPSEFEKVIQTAVRCREAAPEEYAVYAAASNGLTTWRAVLHKTGRIGYRAVQALRTLENAAPKVSDIYWDALDKRREV